MTVVNTGALRERLSKSLFPRSSTYDPQWVLDHAMAGPPVLWLVEWLTERLDLKPGMRVLDLGCGEDHSVFLAKEFSVTVWAADLWIKPTENFTDRKSWNVISRLSVDGRAHALPFADGYFDAVVSFDAYHYFGTDDLYLGIISKFIRSVATRHRGSWSGARIDRVPAAASCAFLGLGLRKLSHAIVVAAALEQNRPNDS